MGNGKWKMGNENLENMIYFNLLIQSFNPEIL